MSLPERHYDLAGQVMAEAITNAEETAVPITAALSAAARQAGHTIGAEAKRRAGSRPSRARALQAVQEVLAEKGYEPRFDDNGLSLANCPFHILSAGL